jgi:hypothetical protein
MLRKIKSLLSFTKAKPTPSEKNTTQQGEDIVQKAIEEAYQFLRKATGNEALAYLEKVRIHQEHRKLNQEDKRQEIELHRLQLDTFDKANSKIVDLAIFCLKTLVFTAAGSVVVILAYIGNTNLKPIPEQLIEGARVIFYVLVSALVSAGVGYIQLSLAALESRLLVHFSQLLRLLLVIVYFVMLVGFFYAGNSIIQGFYLIGRQ